MVDSYSIPQILRAAAISAARDLAIESAVGGLAVETYIASGSGTDDGAHRVAKLCRRGLRHAARRMSACWSLAAQCNTEPSRIDHVTIQQ